jgi:hypothetical protein
MNTRGPPPKTSKKPNFKFPHLDSLRNSAQNPEIPPEHFSPPRDPIFGVFTCVPLLEKFLQKNQNPNSIQFPPISPFLAISRRPIIKGLRTDLILSVTRCL